MAQVWKEIHFRTPPSAPVKVWLFTVQIFMKNTQSLSRFFWRGGHILYRFCYKSDENAENTDKTSFTPLNKSSLQIGSDLN